MQKPAFPEDEQPDYNPVCGMLSGKLRTKLWQRLGFTAPNGSTHSRTRRTCAEGFGARDAGSLCAAPPDAPLRFRPGSRPRQGAVVLAGPLAPVSAHWSADARLGHYFDCSAISRTFDSRQRFLCSFSVFWRLLYRNTLKWF